MAEQPSTTDFVPKQAYPPNADLYEEIVGDSTSNIARGFMKLIPPISSGSVIHDNGCGGGQVIHVIMEQNPPRDIVFEATDIDATQLQHCREAAAAAAGHWPVNVSEMPAESLRFGDETFTHSFSNLLLFATRNTGVDAAREIYRTLKPGGTAVATWFNSIPHQEIVKEMHRDFRGAESRLPHGMPEAWYEPEFLQSTLVQGGFTPEKLKMSVLETPLTIPDLKRWVEILWSYIGRPMEGWRVADEEGWDRVIGTLVKKMEESPFYTTTGKGGRMGLRVNVCVATK
ncbi:S-adenosyl-L-methionine-dependent methyltransferase [Xylaria sp. CBS 124048]|nr:S-adenosyl-L-methionine-dependent methyltransferase [Xylaria sp. CBS 124048]